MGGHGFLSVIGYGGTVPLQCTLTLSLEGEGTAFTGLQDS
jgi:hypothetical protein